MSDRNLKLSIAFQAIDKMSGSIKSIAKGSEGMAKKLRAAREEMQSLRAVESKLAGFRKLKRGLTESEAKLQDKQRAVAKLAREMARAEKPSRALTRQFSAAKKAAAKSKTELAAKRTKLEQLRRELDKAGYATSDMVRSEKRLRQAMDRTNRTIDRQKDGLARLHRLKARSGKIRGVGIGMSAGMTAPIGLMAQQSFQAAMDAQELQSAFDQTFKASADSMNAWAVATGDTMGRSTQEMQRGANAFGLFFNEAFDPAQSAEMSRQFAVLAQDLESFHNLRPGQGIEKLRAGLSGESEPLKQLGVMLNETQVKAKAAEMGLVAVGGRLTEQQKVMVRSALIMEKTVNAQGDVARTSDSTANRLRAAAGAWEEFQISIGEKLLPAITPLIDKIAKLLDWFNSLSPGMQTASVVALALAAAIGPLMIGFAAMAGLIGTVSAPILAIAAAIAAVVAVVVANWDSISSWFEQNFGPVIGGLSKKMAPLAEKMRGLFSKIGAWATQVFGLIQIVLDGPLGDLLKMLMEVFGGIVLFAIDNLIGVLSGLFDMITNGVAFVSAVLTGDWGAAWEAVKGIFWGAISAINSLLGGLPAKFLQFGIDMIGGLVNGIKAAPERVWNALKSIIMGSIERVKGWLDINSPSRVFMGLGASTAEGMTLGIDKGRQRVLRATGRLAAGVAAAGALSIAPATAAVPSSAARPAAQARAPTSFGSVTIHIHQQAGQDAKELAQEVRAELENMAGIGRRRHYGDGA